MSWSNGSPSPVENMEQVKPERGSEVLLERLVNLHLLTASVSLHGNVAVCQIAISFHASATLSNVFKDVQEKTADRWEEAERKLRSAQTHGHQTRTLSLSRPTVVLRFQCFRRFWMPAAVQCQFLIFAKYLFKGRHPCPSRFGDLMWNHLSHQCKMCQLRQPAPTCCIPFKMKYLPDLIVLYREMESNWVRQYSILLHAQLLFPHHLLACVVSTDALWLSLRLKPF